MSTIRCPNCGAVCERSEGAFCGGCGGRLPPEPTDSSAAVTPARPKKGPGTLTLTYPVPFSVGAPAEPDEQTDVGSAELLLQLNDNRFRMQGHAGILDLRLTNIADVPVEEVGIGLESTLLAEPYEATFRLRPGQQVRRHLAMVAGQGGDHLLNFTVCYKVAGEWKAFIAQATLMVLDQFDTPEKLVIDMREMIKVEATKVLGTAIQTDVERLVSQGLVKTNIDLMTREFPDRFQDIPLEFDFDETERLRQREATAEVKSVAAGFEGPPAALDRVALRTEVAGRPLNVLFLAQPYVRFGRHRDSNEVVLRCLPLSPQSRSDSLRISKDAHFAVTLRRDEGLAVIDEPPSLNGTTLNGQLILGEHVIERDLYRPSRLDVAAGALKLRLDFFREQAEERSPYERLMKRGVPDLWALAGAVGLRGLRLTRVNNLGPGDESGEERYVLVYRWVQIGSSTGNAVVLRVPGVDEIHARLLHFDGGFWLEALSPTEPTKVDGRLIDQDALVPLAPGMTLTLGEVTVEFTEGQQLCL